MMVAVGDRVKVSKVFVFPSEDTWEDGAQLEMEPVDNLRVDEVAIVVGESRRKYRAEVRWCITGDGGYTCGSEGWFREWMPSTRAFITVRYSLRGGRCYTTPEYITKVEESAE